MTGLTVTACVLAVAIVALVWLQQVERNRWATERRQLVDRVIAKHTGEVIALDRTSPRRSSLDNEVDRPADRPVAIGL